MLVYSISDSVCRFPLPFNTHVSCFSQSPVYNNGVMKKMSPVVHFEMPAKDKKRVKKFYETAFGWEMSQLGSGMADYILAITTPVDKKTQRPKEPGAINGGFYQSGEYGTTPHIVIAVDNLKKNMEAVKNAGGSVLGEPMDIPGVGTFVMIHDTEGNRVGMLQPSPGM